MVAAHAYDVRAAKAVYVCLAFRGREDGLTTPFLAE